MTKSFFRGLVAVILLLQSNIIQAQSGYFYRSRQTGVWNTASSWEWSNTVNGTYTTATAAPNNTANSILIQNGHTITINSNVSLDETTVALGGTLRWVNGNLDVVGGSNNGLTIIGLFEDAKNSAGLPSVTSASGIVVASGGVVRVTVEKNKKDGYASNNINDGLKEKINWQHGSIFDWAVNLAFEDDNATYFPNAGEGVIPIFRITGSPGPDPFSTIGKGNPFVINGLLEINKALTLQLAGQKTFRNGVIGTSNLTMNADCGKMLINGQTSVIGGTGSIMLNANGLDVSSEACTLISNKIINQNHASGTIRLMSNAILIAQTFAMSGTAIFHQQDNAHLKTAHANGVSGSIQTNTYTHGTYCHFTFNGAANQITGARMPATVGDVFIENSGTAGSNNNVAVTNTGLQTIQGNLTIMYGQMNLNSTAGADVLLHGNFTRYVTGTYNDNNRTTSFTGSKDSHVNTPLVPPASASNPTLQDYGVAVVNKANGYKVILNTPTGIGKKITLINGIIDAIANPLYIKNAVADDGNNNGVIGGNNNSYVNGKLYRYMSPSTTGTYAFPIGKTDAGPGGKYKPVSFLSTAVASPGAVFRAEYFGGFKATPEQGPDEKFLSASLTGILRDEFWQFDRIEGTEDHKGKLILPYENPGAGKWRDADGNSLDPCATCNVAIAKRNTDNGAGIWAFTKTDNNFLDNGPLPETRFNTDNGLLITGELSTFSPFTVGYGFNTILGSTRSLPVRLLSFAGTATGHQGLLNWTIDSDKDLSGFVLEQSSNGQQYLPAKTIGPKGISYSNQTVQLKPGTNYFRLKVQEKSGNSYYSPVLLLNGSAAATVIVGMQQTVVQHTATAQIQSAGSQTADVKLIDLSGKLLLSKSVALHLGSNQVQVPVGNLQKGLYILLVSTRDGVQRNLRFIKE
ncbi:T9SS type A sorting domain-containing protein [Phnomibacter sp. MR]|uniref:T9SS type A sorting domain-containing protein n=1 Tax=Phnomibacter sp. MR TaxID=3042318 RepID=UPI003A7FA200